MAQIIFITGTDTGVGKTVLTGLLLRHLRDSGRKALAMKPICSGSRADARLLQNLQENSLTLDEINPFFFAPPVAPAAAAGRGRKLRLDTVLKRIQAIAGRCDVLLVEGAGGLLVPLGENFTIADLIARLGCPAMVVSRNRLGTINHTLLTVKVMQQFGIENVTIVMVEEKKPDISAQSNVKMIQKMGPKVPVYGLPNLGNGASKPAVIKKSATFLKKTLAQILDHDIFGIVLSRGKKRLFNKTR